MRKKYKQLKVTSEDAELHCKAGPSSRDFKVLMANEPSKRDLNAEADEALDAARSMPNGPEKNEALKKAGMLRKAADDAAGIAFAKRGRPRQ